MKRNGLLFFLSLFSITAFGEVFPIEGGERSFIDGDVLNTFRASDKLVVTDATTVHALFVAGGGGGGTGVGGGGGGGGVVEIKELTLQPGTYDVIVGVGGAGASSSWYTGVNGGDSSITDVDGAAVHERLPALGGGGGGSWDKRGGASGGTGGGSCGTGAPGSGTEGQGYSGGISESRTASGGGGAGGPGGPGLMSTTPRPASAVGGIGYESSITGVSVRYGGGGGGGGGDTGASPASRGTDGGGDGTHYASTFGPQSGVDGLGGGGGGAGWNSSFLGGSGGDGIVILRYAFDCSTKAEPICIVNDVTPAVAGAAIDIDVESIGASATFLDISATATPVNGGTIIEKSLKRVAGKSSEKLIFDGLRQNTEYSIAVTATNDAGKCFVSDGFVIETLSKYGNFLGGDEFIYLNDRTVHIFKESGVLTVNRGAFVDILVVAGGGGGGRGVGGGGGGGGVVYKTSYILTNGIYNVIVGAGGAGGNSSLTHGSNGGDSSIADIIALGGGGGGNWESSGFQGGCGGGASGLRVTGWGYQGFDGGAGGSRSSGGGGGAGGPGGPGPDGANRQPTAIGGVGYPCSITGVEVRYGGGGGAGGGDSGRTPASPGTDGGGDGSPYAAEEAPGNGVDGLGAGGGGSGYNYNFSATFNGGNGGSGVVIISYAIPPMGLSIIIR